MATLSGPVVVNEERLEAAARNLAGEKRAKERVRLLRARGTAELRKVASSSATQGFWLETEKWDLR